MGIITSFRHSLNGQNILLGECFACALQESAVSFVRERKTEEDLILDQILSQNGKQRYEIEGFGYCLVQAWHYALSQIGESYEGDWKDLMNESLHELEYRPVFYNLVGNYKEEISKFRHLAEYTSGAIDSLPFALSNVTKVQCVIHQVTAEGFSCPIVMTPMDAENKPLHGCPQIELVFARKRRHYDAVLNAIASESGSERNVSKEKLASYSIKKLLQIAKECDIDMSDCIEKRDIIEKIANTDESQKKRPESESTNVAAHETSADVNGDSDSDCIVTSVIDANTDSLQDSKSEEDEACFKSANIDAENRKYHRRRRKPKRKKTPTSHYWKDYPIQVVEGLPYDINGEVVYLFPFDIANRMKSSSDGRPWQTWVSSSRKGFSGIRRVASCKGSYICQNEKCHFKMLYQKSNQVHFDMKDGQFVCRTCGIKGVELECFPQKIWEFNDSNEVTVFHTGKHTCQSVKKTPLKTDNLNAKFSANNTPKQAGDSLIVDALNDDTATWEDVINVVDSVVDREKIKNTRKKFKRSERPHGHNFEAVGRLRSKIKDKDPFFIYKINDCNLNGEPSFVFKMSRVQAKLAAAMDRHNREFLSEEYCYFDGTFKRCPGYVTLSAFVYVSILQRTVKLATMECEQENADMMIIFWNNFNEVISKYLRIPEYKFNPTGWCVDEHGGNWEAIRQVFGEDAVGRTVGCEFHYKHSVEKRARMISNERSKEKFKKIADSMMVGVTERMYNDALSAMKVFIKEKPEERQFLTAWLKWWHDRKSHFSRAFKPVNAVPVNLAEGYHSSYVTTSSVNLKLVDAAYMDIAESLRLERSLHLYGEGGKCSGTGPAQKERDARDHTRQQKRADHHADDLIYDEDDYRQKNENKSKRKHREDESSTSSDDESAMGCKTKNKAARKPRVRKQRSKELLKSLTKAKCKRFNFCLLRNTKIHDSCHEYYVKGEKEEYKVTISTNPSCTCPFFTTRSTKVPCKHLIWTMLFQLNVH